MAEALRRGYATTSTTQATPAREDRSALGHREVTIGDRSEHEMTVKAGRCHQRVLRSRAGVALEWLLDRWTPGPRRSAALPNDLMEHCGRQARGPA